jgi:hypothetical protein
MVADDEDRRNFLGILAHVVDRYVVLNTVQAKLVADPRRWRWSSYGRQAEKREHRRG